MIVFLRPAWPPTCVNSGGTKLSKGDLASVAGDRYNYGVNNRPVNIFVDEAAEVTEADWIMVPSSLVAESYFAAGCDRHKVRVNPLAPDLVHPGEDAQLSASRAERGRRVERIQRFLQPGPPLAPMPDRGEGWLSARSSRSPQESRRHWQADTPKPAEQTAVCVHCGQVTEDWWQAWWEGEIHRCKCRACLEKGLE